MTQDTETQILVELRGVNDRLTQLEAQIEQSDVQSQRFDERFADYRGATQWVVNLSFGLIASATVITIVGTIFKR